MAVWVGNPVCWWLGLCFCLVCCLGEKSCTGCCWKLGFAGSCIQVEAFVEVITNQYSLGLRVLWQPRFLESMLPLQRLMAWSLAGELKFHKWFVLALKGVKSTHKNKTKGKPQIYGKYKIRQIIAEIMEYTHTYTHINKTKTVQKRKYKSGPASEGNQKWYQPVKNKVQNGNQSKVPTEE